jgi:hypothetical protein
MNTSLHRLDKTYKLDNLPTLKSNSFNWNGLTGYSGSLIKRSMDKTAGVYRHYGFIYGFDNNDTLWVIENNENGVECVTFRDFIDKNIFYTIEHNISPDNFGEIMDRAFERMHLPYERRTNNCELFTNYAIFGKLESGQTQRTEFFVNALITFVEINLSKYQGTDEILKTYDEFRTTIKLDRNEDWNNLLNLKRAEDVENRNKLKSNK